MDLCIQARAAGNSSISGSVVFWNQYNTVGPENSTLVTKVLPAFQKAYPNITVYSQNYAGTSFRAEAHRCHRRRQRPDVIRSDIINVPLLAKIGALASTDSIVAKRKSEFYPGPLATNYYQGHYYGLPLDTNTRVLIYNKAVFAKAGITTPPATSDEFMADAVKIAATGKNVFGYAEGGTDGWNLLPWIFSFGGAITNPDVTKASGYINSPNSVAALQFLVTMLDQHLLSPSLLGGGLQTSDAIGKNQAGMILDGPWTPPIFLTTYPKLQLGFAPVPAGPNGIFVFRRGRRGYRTAQEQQEHCCRQAFLQFMTSPQAQELMGEVGQMPVLKSLANDPKLPALLRDLQQGAADSPAAYGEPELGQDRRCADHRLQQGAAPPGDGTSCPRHRRAADRRLSEVASHQGCSSGERAATAWPLGRSGHQALQAASSWRQHQAFTTAGLRGTSHDQSRRYTRPCWQRDLWSGRCQVLAQATKAFRRLLPMYLLIIPGMALFLTWTLYPLADAFVMSFFQWNPNPSGTSTFLGRKQLWQGPARSRVLAGFGNVVWYTIVTVPVQMALGLGVALLLNRKLAGTRHVPRAVLSARRSRRGSSSRLPSSSCSAARAAWSIGFSATCCTSSPTRSPGLAISRSRCLP